MITVLCANAGVDKTYEVPGFTVGGFHHPRRLRIAPGGKGINVARVLRALGHEVTVTGFLGGNPGQWVAGQLRREEIIPDFIQTAEDSRLCINVVDPTRKTQTRLDELGPLVTPTEVEALRRKWDRLLQDSAMAVIAGNAPRGVPFDLYGELVLMARGRQVPLVLDAHDELLRDAAPAGPTVLTPNLAELSVLFGGELSVPDGVLQASRQLVQSGTKVVICTLGAEGALIVTPNHGEWRARAPRVDVVSSVGCGDSLVAGFVSASVERRPLPERIRWAVAAGAACAATFGAGFATRAEIEALLPKVAVGPATQPTPPAPTPAQQALSPEAPPQAAESGDEEPSER